MRAAISIALLAVGILAGTIACGQDSAEPQPAAPRAAGEPPTTPLAVAEPPATLGAPPDYRLLVLSDAPVLYVRFGAGEPELARDETARHDGSYVGGVRLTDNGPPGAGGGAAVLDGETTYVNVEDSRFLRLDDSFTLETWVRPDSIGEEQRLLHKGPGWALLDLTADGRIRFGKSSAGTIAVSSVAITEAGDWHHVAASKDGDRARVYVDGADVTSLVENHTIENTNDDLNIGRTVFGEKYFAGAIDDVAIYDRVLSAEQIAAHFAAGQATWRDGDAPRVELLGPVAGARRDRATLVISGRAGQDEGDLDHVEVELFAGADLERPAAAVASAVPDANGRWAVETSGQLAAGDYVARATQRDAAGNVGTAISERFSATEAPSPLTEAVVLAAGDIAGCAGGRHEATFALIEDHPGATVAALGDVVYEEGSAAEFAECYAPSWGQALEQTRPALGNHEYLTEAAAGYFDFFAETLAQLGAGAGDPSRGWYSYELGSWHVVVLNSNCAEVAGGCGSGSPQDEWLRADLADSGSRCTLAYWHHPRFSSSAVHPASAEMAPLWETLDDAGAELVLTGHHHAYERFGPQRADGTLDLQRGISQFIVGTGGRGSYESSTVLSPNSAARASDTFGVLKLSLADGAYSWEFLNAEGSDFADSGTRRCHD